jgi:HMG (high mobility group) box
MQTVIQNLIQNLSKVGRTTIDFTNEDDVAFFTPLMNEALIQEVTKNDKKVKKAKKAAVVDKVKKDLNSYMIYCEWARKNAEFPDKQPKAISRRLGEMWRALSDEEKAGYKQQAAANKRPAEARADSPQRAESPSADSAKPKKPLTSYIKFSNAMRDSVKTAAMNPQDVSRQLGEMWRALTAEEKAKWKGDDVSVAVVVEKKDEPVVVAAVAPVVEEEKKEPVEDKRDESPKKSKKTKKDAPVEQAADDTEPKTEKKEKKTEKKSKKASE